MSDGEDADIEVVDDVDGRCVEDYEECDIETADNGNRVVKIIMADEECYLTFSKTNKKSNVKSFDCS